MRIGDGLVLLKEQQDLIESRFVTSQEAAILCPNGIKLFFTNASVSKYNKTKLTNLGDIVTCVSENNVTGTSTNEELVRFTTKANALSIIETGGVPYDIDFVMEQPYTKTTNIDEIDDLADGQTGFLSHLEYLGTKIIRAWLKFPQVSKIGRKAAKRYAPYAVQHGIKKSAVPVCRRIKTITLHKSKNVQLH